MAKAPIEDTPDEQQPEQQEFEIKDTPQGGVSVPAGEEDPADAENPAEAEEERQNKRREEVLDAIGGAKDLLRGTGPTSEAGMAVMKLEEAETWVGKTVFP
jgi:hypothetical protein